jgi:penicillin-binding protein 2
VQGVYPPGSTFKMVTLLAGLESGIINEGTRYYCNGALDVAGRKFHCWSRGGHGSVSAVESLMKSCDVYYYELARAIGIDRIAEMARRLGIGVEHDLPMSAVATGIAPDRAWKKERFDKPWVVGDSLNASIGQGFVLASPLQLAVMTRGWPRDARSSRALSARLMASRWRCLNLPIWACRPRTCAPPNAAWMR